MFTQNGIKRFGFVLGLSKQSPIMSNMIYRAVKIEEGLTLNLTNLKF